MKSKVKFTSKSHSELMAKNASKVNKAKKPDGYLYVLKYGNNNLFKFGVSSNPDRRIKDIDACSPVAIKELGRYFFKNVYEIEEMIHDNLKEAKIRREWFKMEELSVLCICNQLQEMSNEGIYLIRIDG